MKKKVSTIPSDDPSEVAALDLQRINGAAERLNSEAAEVLEYQARTRTKDDAEA